MKPKYLLLILLTIPFTAFADYKVGLMADFGFLMLDDPDGENSQRGNFVGVGITGKYPLKWRGQNVLSGIGYLQGSSSASATDVGQNYSGYYAFSRWQIRTPLARNFPDAYSFIGAKYMSTKHKDRHTVYEGYLKDRFNDRSVNAFDLSMGFSYQIKHASGASSIPSLYVDVPLSGKIMLIGASYQYEF